MGAYRFRANQVELLKTTQQIVPKAGSPQEKNEEGFEIQGQGGSATKPGPNTQIIRLSTSYDEVGSQIPSLQAVLTAVWITASDRSIQ